MTAGALRSKAALTAMVAVPVTALGILGVTLLRSIAPSARWDAGLLPKQILWFVIGALVAGVAVALPPRLLRRSGPPLLAATIAGLLAVHVVGQTSSGATRWFNFGPLLIQPAEFAKLTYILAFAGFVGGLNNGRPKKWSDFVWPPAALGLAAVLTASEPNLQATLVIAGVGTLMLALVRWPGWAWLSGILIGVGSLGVAALRMPAYQIERVQAFLHPNVDPYGAGFEVNLLSHMVSSGELLGHGSGSWLFSWAFSRSDAAVDFPFAIWCFEHGFVGALLLLALEFAVVGAACWIALCANDRYGRALSLGVAAFWLLHTVVAAAVSLTLVPTASVAMPLISYGGSHSVAALLSVGLLLHVVRNSPKSL